MYDLVRHARAHTQRPPIPCIMHLAHCKRRTLAPIRQLISAVHGGRQRLHTRPACPRPSRSLPDGRRAAEPARAQRDPAPPLPHAPHTAAARRYYPVPFPPPHRPCQARRYPGPARARASTLGPRRGRERVGIRRGRERVGSPERRRGTEGRRRTAGGAGDRPDCPTRRRFGPRPE